MNFLTLPYKIGGSVLLALALFTGVWTHGYRKGKARGEAAVAAFVAQKDSMALEIERSQTRINELLLDRFHQKVDTIRIRTVRNVEVIRDVPPPVVVASADTTQPPVIQLPRGWVSLHNASARNDDADSASIADGAASGITPNTALRFVVLNYGTCTETASRLLALQDWIRKSQANIDSINKARRPR